MKISIISAALMAATFATVPLAAQPSYSGQYQDRAWNSNDFWRGAPNGPWERIRFLQQRIDRGARDGSLDRREARRAQLQLNRIRYDAQQMRRNGLTRRESSVLQGRLDNLSRNLRWARNNGWSRDDRNSYATDYDAQRYYRDGPQYSERYLSSEDEVYRGSDGRYYCKRSDGTTGLVIGGVGGAVLGNVIGGKTAGTLIGGALGALLGRQVDRNRDDVRCR